MSGCCTCSSKCTMSTRCSTLPGATGWMRPPSATACGSVMRTVRARSSRYSWRRAAPARSPRGASNRASTVSSACSSSRACAAWQPFRDGYRVEIAAPLSMLGERFGVLVDDRDARGAAPVSYGTLRSDDLHTLGRLIVAAPELSSYLAQFTQPGLKLAISAPDGRALAHVDALAQGHTLSSGSPRIARLYRRFIDRPGAPSLIEAQAPIYDRDHRAVIGALAVTQTPDRWLRLRDRALTRMLNFTLGTSVAAVVLMFAFAAWLALRLARLCRASESALTRSGLVTAFPETAAR